MWTKIGQSLEDSSSHCPFLVELVYNRWKNRIGEVITGAGQGGQGSRYEGPSEVSFLLKKILGENRGTCI